MITNEPYGAEPWSPHREQPRPGPAGAERVGLRAVQRAHRAARQPRRGRAARAAGHLPELGLRGPAAAVRGGGLRLPRHRADRHQRHQRQDHPAAGRRRAVRHQVRHPPRDHTRTLDLRAGTLTRNVDLDVARRAHGQGQVGAARVADPARDRRDQLHGHAGRRDAPPGAACRSWSPTRTSPPPRATPAPPPCSPSRWSARSTWPSTAGSPRAVLVHSTRLEPAAAGRRDEPRHPRPRAKMAIRVRVVPRPGPLTDRGRGPGGEELRIVKYLGYGWSAERSRPALIDQVAAPRGRPADRLGRAAGGAARLPGRLLGGRRRRGRRRRRDPAGGQVRALPHPAGRAPGPSTGRSRPRA